MEVVQQRCLCLAMGLQLFMLLAVLLPYCPAGWTMSGSLSRFSVDTRGFRKLLLKGVHDDDEETSRAETAATAVTAAVTGNSGSC